jgi:hypothetical protein
MRRNELIAWLLEGPSWVAYRTRRDLLNQAEYDAQVQTDRQAMLDDPLVQALVEEVSGWPGEPLRNHKAAGHLLHKISFLADVGFTVKDPPIAELVGRILKHQAPEGPFQVLMNIPRHYGGSGEDQWAWMLCDAPVLLYALVKFGAAENGAESRIKVQKAFNHLASLVRDNGWPCAAAPEFGKFRGPGRKADPCPYANLVMLKALSQYPEGAGRAVVQAGAEALLTLWEQRKDRKPYLFAMGTDFAKLKAPFIWYDILHVSEVLTHFAWLRNDERLKEMIRLIQAKGDEQGKYSAESIWRAWKGWDFGQKRQPSPWVTLLVQRLLKRFEERPGLK